MSRSPINTRQKKKSNISLHPSENFSSDEDFMEIDSPILPLDEDLDEEPSQSMWIDLDNLPYSEHPQLRIKKRPATFVHLFEKKSFHFYFERILKKLLSTDCFDKFSERVKEKLVATQENLEWYLLFFFFSFASQENILGQNYIFEQYNLFKKFCEGRLNVASLSDFPSLETMKIYHAHLYFLPENLEEILKIFQNEVCHTGTFFTCDEILIKCNKNCPDIVYDKNKPAQKGYWFTEIVLTTVHNYPYIIHSLFKKTGMKVVDIVEKWINVLQSMNSYDAIMLFDGFYSSAKSIKKTEENNVNVICAIRPNIISGISNHTLDSDDFEKPVPTTKTFKFNPENRSMIYSVQLTTRAGKNIKKFAYSNLFKTNHHYQGDTTINSEDLSTLYHGKSNACDRLNRFLSGYNNRFLYFKHTYDKPDTDLNLLLGSTLTKFTMKVIFHNIRILTMEYLITGTPYFNYKKYTAAAFAEDMIIARLNIKYPDYLQSYFHYETFIHSRRR